LNASARSVCTFEVQVDGEADQRAVQAHVDAMVRLIVRSEQGGVQFQGWLFSSVSARLPADGSENRMIVRLVSGVELPKAVSDKIDPRKLFQDALALPARIGLAPGVWLERSAA